MVHIEWFIFPGGNKGRAAALPQPIALLRAQIRLFLEDPEAADYIDRNVPTPILLIGNIECFWKVEVDVQLANTWAARVTE